MCHALYLGFCGRSNVLSPLASTILQAHKAVSRAHELLMMGKYGAAAEEHRSAAKGFAAIAKLSADPNVVAAMLIYAESHQQQSDALRRRAASLEAFKNWNEPDQRVASDSVDGGNRLSQTRSCSINESVVVVSMGNSRERHSGNSRMTAPSTSICESGCTRYRDELELLKQRCARLELEVRTQTQRADDLAAREVELSDSLSELQRAVHRFATGNWNGRGETFVPTLAGQQYMAGLAARRGLGTIHVDTGGLHAEPDRPRTFSSERCKSPSNEGMQKMTDLTQDMISSMHASLDRYPDRTKRLDNFISTTPPWQEQGVAVVHSDDDGNISKTKNYDH